MSGSNAGVFWLIYIVFWLGIYAFMFWAVLNKAGIPGWWSIIPILNYYGLVKLAGKSGWWVVLLFIPLVNTVVYIMLSGAISKAFGHGWGFAIGLILLPIIFYPILGFGSSQYEGSDPLARPVTAY